MSEEIIYFELNNWFAGHDYPDDYGIFEKWCGNDEKLYFNSERWCKENNLVVTSGTIDMSINWCIAATKEWVEKNCPELLTKYTEFLRPDMKSRFGQPFKEYTKENIGLYFCDLMFGTNKWEFWTEEESQKWKKEFDKDIYGE